jgi:hypothetical protein
LTVQLTLFISVSENALLTGLQESAQIDAQSLPLFYGDTLALKVYLLNKLESKTLADFPYEKLSTSGLAFFLYLTDGKASPTIYTQQIVWQTDANGLYFYANLALNTAALASLLGTATQASCWLKAGFTQAGLPITVLSKQVNISAGMPGASLDVPAGLTPLSVEVANATYAPLIGCTGIQFISPSGKIILARAVDNPDGTASFEQSPIN